MRLVLALVLASTLHATATETLGALNSWKKTISEGVVDEHWKLRLRSDGKFVVTAEVYGANTTCMAHLVNSQNGAVSGTWNSGPHTSNAFSTAPYYLSDSSTLFIWSNYSTFQGKAAVVRVSSSFKTSKMAWLTSDRAEYGSTFYPGIPNNLVIRDVGVFVRSPYTVYNTLTSTAATASNVDIKNWAFVGAGGGKVIFQRYYSVYVFNNTFRAYSLPVSANKYQEHQMNDNMGNKCLQWAYPNGVLAGPPYNAVVDNNGNFYSTCDAGPNNTTWSLWSWTSSGKFRFKTPSFPLKQVNQPYIGFTPAQKYVVFGVWVLNGTRPLHVSIQAIHAQTGKLTTNTDGKKVAVGCHAAMPAKPCTWTFETLADGTAVFECYGAKYKQYCGVNIRTGEILPGAVSNPFAANSSISATAGFDSAGNIYACGVLSGAKEYVVCGANPTAGCFKTMKAGCLAESE